MIIAGSVCAFIVILIASSAFIEINPCESVLYKIQQYITYNKEDWENYEQLKARRASVSGNMDMMVSPASPVEDLYPVDPDRVIASIRDAEIQKIKDAHFENLKLARNAPTDEEVRIALIRFTNGRLTDVIINQKLNIKVGKCYENPDPDAPGCVSCMILLYNRNTNAWQEAPMGENFMKNAYDFYPTGFGWGAKDLSMRIPFDYELFNQFGYSDSKTDSETN